MSESDGSAIFGGTDALSEDIIPVSDALVDINISSQVQLQDVGRWTSFETSDGHGRKTPSSDLATGVYPTQNWMI